MVKLSLTRGLHDFTSHTGWPGSVHFLKRCSFYWLGPISQQPNVIWVHKKTASLAMAFRKSPIPPAHCCKIRGFQSELRNHQMHVATCESVPHQIVRNTQKITPSSYLNKYGNHLLSPRTLRQDCYAKDLLWLFYSCGLDRDRVPQCNANVLWNFHLGMFRKRELCFVLRVSCSRSWMAYLWCIAL